MKRLFYNLTTMNILTLLLTVLFLALPAVFIGWNFLYITIIFAGVVLLMSSPGRIDPTMLGNIRKPGYGEYPRLQEMLLRLSQSAGLELAPELYIAENSQPNAAAILTTEGEGIIINRGLFNVLDERQAQAVIAHEIAHIRNGDLWLLNLLARFRMFYSSVPRMILPLFIFIPMLLLFFLPLASVIWGFTLLWAASVVLERTIMRLREYGADYTAARIVGGGEDLASALEKITTPNRTVNWFGFRVTVPGNQSMQEPDDFLSRLLRSHPSTASRVQFLRRLGRV